MSLRIAFIGFGEAGPCLAEGLIQAGATVTAAYDTLLIQGEAGEPVRTKAEKLGVRAVPSAKEAVAHAEVIISAVTSDQTVVAARDTAPHLAPGQFYLDINSASPGMKREAASCVGGSGAWFVESAVMSNVPPHGHRVPMLLAGKAAAELGERLRPFGMNVEAIGTEVGQASAVKMCRSVMVKGLEGLFVECLTAAHRLGVTERVLDSLYESFEGFDWRRYAGYHLGRVALHARRRAAEMREAAETVAETGVSPLMATAAADLLDRCAEEGWRERYGSAPPEDYRQFLARFG